MKLSTIADGSADGKLMLVSRDLIVPSVATGQGGGA